MSRRKKSITLIPTSDREGGHEYIICKSLMICFLNYNGSMYHSGVLLQPQILKRQLLRQMFVRKLLIFSLFFLLSNLKYFSNKCFQDKM